MTRTDCIRILNQFLAWRRGEIFPSEIRMTRESEGLLMQAIDFAIAEMTDGA